MRRISCLVAWAALGCSTAPNMDAAVPQDALHDLARPWPDAGSMDQVAALALDRPADAPLDSRPPPTGLPLPAGVAPPRRILDDPAMLTGAGRSSCTHQELPSGNGDRWCVFTRPGMSPKSAELWVMNVTKASSGEVPPCDGTSPACLLMTANLWTEFPTIGPGHPYSHAFDGDTLIFYPGNGAASQEIYRGPVHAWRPGWSRPRPITSDRGLLCMGHRRAPVAHCLDDVIGDPKHPDSFELRAGAIVDETGGILPSLGRIRPFRADGATAWQVAFSPKGDLLAVSSPDPDPAVESLRVIPTNELGRAGPKEVLRDLKSWTIGNDGSRIYFLRDETQGLDGLYQADLPTASTVTKVATRIEDYVIVGEGAVDQGVGFLTRLDTGLTAFRLAPDTSTPTNTPTVFTVVDTLEDAHVSSDGRFTAWRDGELVARVVRNQDLSSCTLNSSDELNATAPWFLASSGLVFWTENSLDHPDRQDGFWASPDDCRQRTLFAEGVYLVEEVVGDRGYIFADEHDEREETVTLKYAAVTRTGEQWRLNAAVRIDDTVRPSVTLVGTNPILLLYRRKTGGDRPAGTYLLGPAPF